VSALVTSRLTLLLEEDLDEVQEAAGRLRHLLAASGVLVDAFVEAHPQVLYVDDFATALEVGGGVCATTHNRTDSFKGIIHGLPWCPPVSDHLRQTVLTWFISCLPNMLSDGGMQLIYVALPEAPAADNLCMRGCSIYVPTTGGRGLVYDGCLNPTRIWCAPGSLTCKGFDITCIPAISVTFGLG
jgi:hypothetical protein